MWCVNTILPSLSAPILIWSKGSWICSRLGGDNYAPSQSTYLDTLARLIPFPGSYPPSRRPFEPTSTWFGSFLWELCRSWTPGCGIHVCCLDCEDVFLAQQVWRVYVSLAGLTACHQRSASQGLTAINLRLYQTFQSKNWSNASGCIQSFIFTVVRKISLCKIHRSRLNLPKNYKIRTVPCSTV